MVRPLLRLGLAEELQDPRATEIAAGVEAVAEEFGWSHRKVNGAADERKTDVVIAIGDVSLFPDLVRRPSSARRILWHIETLPRPHTGISGLHTLLPTGRLLDVSASLMPWLERYARFQRSRENAAIVREPIVNLARLRRAAPAFDRIVITSRDRAVGAERAGLKVDVVSLGYDETFAGPLRTGGERPQGVSFLGHLVGRHGRRQRLLEALRSALRIRGTEVTVHTADLYGAQRRRALEQTRIVVDLQRVPGNQPGHRFILASAAGAVLVTEPLLDPTPLVAGIHYLESDVAAMPDVILELLSDEPRRLRIVQAAQALLRGEMSMAAALPRVLGTSAESGRARVPSAL